MPVGMCRLERVEARPREQVEARLQDGGGVGRYIVSYGGGMVPMETPARIPASDDRNFVESCLMLFPVGLLVLPPAEEEEDRQRDNDAHATDTGAERRPIELHECVGLAGLIKNSVVVCLSLFGGLGHGRSL